MADDKIQNNKLQILGKLTASLAHEIRNPLSAIKLNINYLQLIENELPAEATESVKTTLEALDRIEYLIENVLSFSRKNINGYKNCSINEVTKSAIEIVEGSATRLNINIDFESDNNIPLLFYDRNKLLQIFLNLLTNAMESCDSGGEIKIKSFINDKDLVIWEVVDNGVGICENDYDKIFNDFYTNKKKGTGLGLSVCKMLLQEINADLDFESEQGKGARFFIRFASRNYEGLDEV